MNEDLLSQIDGCQSFSVFVQGIQLFDYTFPFTILSLKWHDKQFLDPAKEKGYRF